MIQNGKAVCVSTHNLTVDYVERELAKQLKLGFITLKKPIKGEYIIVEVKNGKIYFKHDLSAKQKYSYSIDLFVRTLLYFCNKKADRTELKKFDNDYVNKPCRVTSFYLLVSLLFDVPVQGNGTIKSPCYVYYNC